MTVRMSWMLLIMVITVWLRWIFNSICIVDSTLIFLYWIYEFLKYIISFVRVVLGLHGFFFIVSKGWSNLLIVIFDCWLDLFWDFFSQEYQASFHNITWFTYYYSQLIHKDNELKPWQAFENRRIMYVSMFSKNRTRLP